MSIGPQFAVLLVDNDCYLTAGKNCERIASIYFE
jgi:hypothetical protein